MNKKDRERLRVSILSDLTQDKQAHSPPKDLLKRYAPLEGGLTSVVEEGFPPGATNSSPAHPLPLVEKSLAPGATVAQKASSAWHDATVVRNATPGTLHRSRILCRGERGSAGTQHDQLQPVSHAGPFCQGGVLAALPAVVRLKGDTCTIGLAKLTKAVRMLQRTLQQTIHHLENRKLIQRVGSNFGGNVKGNVYKVFLPKTVAPPATVVGSATSASTATLAPSANNKRDDDLESQSSSKKEIHSQPVEKHSVCAFAQTETEANHKEPNGCHLDTTRRIYCQVTGNHWTQADSSAYTESRIAQIPLQRVASAIETVARRTPTKINSFNYFVKEITALSDHRIRACHKRQLERIVCRVREAHIGQVHYPPVDFIDDVKGACTREGVRFDHDLFNELCRRN